MDISIMQYNYRNEHLVVVDSDVNVYEYDKCKFDKPFLSFQAKNIFIGKLKVCPMTEFSEAEDKEDFDGNTLLLVCENNEHVYISGLEIFKFKTGDKIIDCVSPVGNNMIPYTFAVGEILHISCHLFTILLKTIELNKELCWMLQTIA